jgi:hypothetical protein
MESGAVQGIPRVLLRVEGVIVLLAALYAYDLTGWSWWIFAALALVPDLSMAGYLAGPEAGAVAYNAAHTYVGPAVLAAFGVWAGGGAALALAAIWVAHIGFDRMVGYGLKYPNAFGNTHLGRIGR